MNPPGVLIMRDEIHRPNFVQSEKTVNKVHDFWENEELFRYCTLPNRGMVVGEPSRDL